MRTNLNFEDDSTKKLLSSFDFKYFLDLNIEKENYSESDIELLNSSYRAEKTKLKEQIKKNKRQFQIYAEGQTRKMFTGGFLSALFELDESREHSILDFDSVGKSQAYFEMWKIYHKRKLTKDKTWNLIVRFGSLLAILLTVFKIIEIINKKS